MLTSVTALLQVITDSSCINVNVLNIYKDVVSSQLSFDFFFIEVGAATVYKHKEELWFLVSPSQKQDSDDTNSQMCSCNQECSVQLSNNFFIESVCIVPPERINSEDGEFTRRRGLGSFSSTRESSRKGQKPVVLV